MTTESRPQAILFADVSGSSTLYKTLGNRRAKQCVDRALGAMIATTGEHDGVLVKTIGDEILARFDSAEQACRAALRIQEDEKTGPEQQGLAIRIGIGFGHTLLEGEDVFGDTVNDAACVTQIARGHQTLITQAVLDALDEPLRRRCQLFDLVALKGSAEPSAIYRLHGENNQTQTTTVLPTDELSRRLQATCLYLRQGGRELQLFAEHTPFAIGRDPEAAQWLIDTHFASREHCHIEFHRGKFVLVDHSTNGTFVEHRGQPTVYLRRESTPLTTSGRIGLGQKPRQAGAWSIEYQT